MKFNNERWKTIPSFENYEASNTGKVRNKSTKQVLKPNANCKGYHHVVLYNGSKKNKQMVCVHRAVAMAWLPPDDFKLTVNHKDENKDNNAVDNLEWLSNKDNIQYSQGKKIKCLETNEVYPSICEASRKTGISIPTIRRILTNKYIGTKRTKLTFEFL